MLIRRFFIVALAALLLIPALPADAQTRERCFPQTGFCISGTIRTYWERNGGLAVFGYPISPVSQQFIGSWQGPAQWFERDRLEDHGNEGLGVLAGRLGAQLLELQGRSWESQPREPSGGSAGCRYFIETGHALCGAFLRYWQRNGGLERFGYPLSSEMSEQVGDWRGTVQYFERRRMELHTELPNNPVLLGLLGRVVSSVEGLPGSCFEAGPPVTGTAWAYRGALGCPYPYQSTAQLAYQPFERGAMLWVPGLGSRLGYGIVVVTRDPNTGQSTWTVMNDTWAAGQPEHGDEVAPAGLYAPVRGFGKVWRENAGIRQALGWATAPESADQGQLVRFEHGYMVFRQNAYRVNLLYFGGSLADEVQPVY